MLPVTHNVYESPSDKTRSSVAHAAPVHEDQRGRPVVADLCCGMGGLSLAARDLGLRVAVGVDIDAHAARTFRRNFPEAEFVEGSVRSAKVLRRCFEILKPSRCHSVPSIVVSGPPCQGFSVAGSRDPSDPRNQILVAVARAITQLNPLCALIENVSMVLAARHASRLNRFEDVLSKAGYFLYPLLLNAVDFGVAQRRKRAFFLVTQRKLHEDEIQDCLECQKKQQLTVEGALRGLPSPEVRPDDYDDEKECSAFHNHLAMRHSKRVIQKIAVLKRGTGPMSYRKLDPFQPSNTLFSGHRAPPAHFQEPRSITVREAARLQGIPDSFRIYGSFGNQMQQVTNAVPPPLARAVLNSLLELVGLTAATHA
jgi:DNA (cytosine-5)-methyltransferase 1